MTHMYKKIYLLSTSGIEVVELAGTIKYVKNESKLYNIDRDVVCLFHWAGIFACMLVHM